MVEEAQEWWATLEYNIDLFDAATISRMLGHFQTLLEGIVANPDERVSDLPLLTETERYQLLVGWNDTQRDYPKDRCVHELFEEQVERTPQATAVMFEEERLSYRELNRRANQLAHRLQALGVGPGVLAGICMERSVEMVVGLLGILKAGGAYVPVDPNYPMERLALVLNDAQTPVLLSQQHLAETFPRHGAEILCLDSEWETIAQESQENPVSEVITDKLAYVIYTSGSTGRPKGVQVAHRALVNFITSSCATFALEPSDRVLQFASISFDTAAEEIFPCLVRGATLVLRTDSMLDSVSAFLQKCRDWGVTVLDLPTVYWHELTAKLSSEHLAIPEQLRLVIIGGEKALPDKLAQWQQCVDGHVRLLNTYGPTEATVVATMWESNGTAQVDESLREVPIGRPIPNVQTYVLDKHLNPVPIGVPGELHIGGAGLARGYLNRPELTREKFIPHPFSKEPGERLYKTGDLARYRPDGNIEFLGRLDYQVKIRGFRVELGEIEAVLGQHPAVRGVAVMAREDIRKEGWESENLKSKIQNPKLDKCLVAYVVSNQQPCPMATELRSFLKEKLPDYMIPSAFVMLDALPLTPNGKTDRRALPAPDQTRPDLEGAFVAPRNPVEEVLAGIWVEVLGFDQVGIHDNFFEIGGHSLLATQVISRVRKSFHVELPLRSLFEKPTIEELAGVITQSQGKGAEQDDLARMLTELEALSDEEAQQLLADG